MGPLARLHPPGDSRFLLRPRGEVCFSSASHQSAAGRTDSFGSLPLADGEVARETDCRSAVFCGADGRTDDRQTFCCSARLIKPPKSSGSPMEAIEAAALSQGHLLRECCRRESLGSCSVSETQCTTKSNGHFDGGSSLEFLRPRKTHNLMNVLNFADLGSTKRY